MNSGSSLNYLDSETFIRTHISFLGREMYRTFLPLEVLFLLSPDAWQTVSLVLVPGEPQWDSDSGGQHPVSSEDRVQPLCLPGHKRQGSVSSSSGGGCPAGDRETFRGMSVQD